METVWLGRTAPKTYTYWMASWREDGKMRNVYPGSTRKLGNDAALQKARRMKAEAQECTEGCLEDAMLLYRACCLM